MGKPAFGDLYLAVAAMCLATGRGVQMVEVSGQRVSSGGLMLVILQ